MDITWFETQLITDTIDYFVGITIASIGYAGFRFFKKVFKKENKET